MIEFRFTPVEPFEWWQDDKLIGQYLPGMSYNCTRHTSHDALRKQCAEWVSDGKINIIGLPPGHYFETLRMTE